MRARSGHRPSFFLFFFLFLFAVSVRDRLFSRCFSGQNKNLLFFFVHATEQVGSPGVGHSGSFPHAPLAVNREMTTLSRRPSPLALRPSITLYVNLYTHGLLTSTPPSSVRLCQRDPTHLVCHVRLGVGDPASARSCEMMVHSDSGMSPTEISVFDFLSTSTQAKLYCMSESCPVLWSSPTSPLARCGACGTFNLTGPVAGKSKTNTSSPAAPHLRRCRAPRSGASDEVSM